MGEPAAERVHAGCPAGTSGERTLGDDTFAELPRGDERSPKGLGPGARADARGDDEDDEEEGEDEKAAAFGEDEDA